MKYLQIYLWKLIFLITTVVVVVGSLIMGMQLSRSMTDSILLQLILAGVIWVAASFMLIKPLSVLDKFLVSRVPLDKDARLNFFLFMTFILISLAIFLSSIYLFKEWWELINDTVHRTLDDYFTIIFPLVLLFASIGTFLGSFKLYKKFEDMVER